MVSGDAQYQRQRAHQKRQEQAQELIKCLECDLEFIRVGSHVVQVHGYSNTAQYRKAHGLMARETSTTEHKERMRSLNTSSKNLEAGKHNRYHIGGNHGKNLTEFWNNRRRNKI